jgi:SAM-dependent methyltransferase
MEVHQLDELTSHESRSGQETAPNVSMSAPRYAPTPEKAVLHLGSGTRPREGALNVDRVQLPGVDVVWDLNTYPWPFATGVWRRVLAYHVLEHLDNLVQAVSELHRILAPGGTAEVRVPHMAGAGAWNNPTHRHFFTRSTFDYFKRGHHYSYSFDFAFSDVQCRGVFGVGRSACLNAFMNPLVNTRLYDRWLWKLIPCAEVHIVLVK